MVHVMSDMPRSTVGFIAQGKVTHADYKNIIYPEVKRASRDGGKINYLLVIETALKNYSSRAWIDDAWLGFKYFTRWGKIAIVSDKLSIKKFTDTFQVFIPGHAKGFMSDQLQEAQDWISNKLPG